MKNIEVISYRDRLNHLFDKTKDFSTDSELQAHWASYLCILVSGFLEISVQTIYRNYASNQAAPNVARFVERKLSGFQNPNMTRILDLTGSFNPNWKENLERATEGELKDAVDSIVANRNNIVHGKHVSITYLRIYQYYQNAIRLVELIENQCKKGA